ncbi:cytochrome P450 [Hypoxylon crocopeplum]|nr:cytochrome P450 [Hypoxylon crocopeplum]
MDVLKVASLLALRHVGFRSWPQVACILFAFQYLLLKHLETFIFQKYFSLLCHIRGPTNNHFFFGQYLSVLKANSPSSPYIEWMQQHPETPLIRYLCFTNTEVLVPTIVNTLENVLQTQCYSSQNAAVWRRMTREMAGEGVIVMINGCFPLKNIRKQLFDRGIAADESKKTGANDSTDSTSKATLDIMGMAILGSKVDEEAAEFGFHDIYEMIFARGTLGNILTLVNGFVPPRWLLFQESHFLFVTCWLNDDLTQLSRDSRDLLAFLTEESLPVARQKVTKAEIVGDLLQFMVANMLLWSLYTMVEKPDIYDLEKLPYLDNFVKELLRVYPRANGMHHETVVDTRVGGIWILEGTTFDIIASLSPYTFAAFSLELRTCIGRTFAMMEMKISSEIV